MQLSEFQSAFDDIGVGLAATVYDDVELVAEFSQEKEIGYTILSDTGGVLASELGILNEQFEPGHFAHGVPHPGIVLLDGDGRVLAKFAVENYRQRPVLEEVIAEVRERL